MGEDVEKLVLDPLQEVEVPPEEKKVKKNEPIDVLEGLVEQGKMDEVILPPPPEKADVVNPQKLEGIAEEGKIAPAILQNEQEKQKDATDLQSQDAAAVRDVGAYATEKESTALEPVRVLEAALFLANKPLSFKQLQDILQVATPRLEELLDQLASQIPPESAIQIQRTEQAACMQLKPKYLERVSHLSKEVELSRKAMRILALVAKKKEFLQSDLKHFFKGEIYAYVTELKNAGYLESKRHGNTRLLRPTGRFYENFQFKAQ